MKSELCDTGSTFLNGQRGREKTEVENKWEMK